MANLPDNIFVDIDELAATKDNLACLARLAACSGAQTIVYSDFGVDAIDKMHIWRADGLLFRTMSVSVLIGQLLPLFLHS
jgi:hypothetical protein